MKTLLLSILLTAALHAAPADDLIAKGAAFEQSGKSREAMAAYQDANKLKPKDPAILVKIAKQYGDLMTETRDNAERKKLGLQSLDYSKQALAAGPNSSEAHLAVAISIGKLTEFMGNQEKIEASRQMKSEADTALKLDPKSDYAHHLLGRWNQELAGMGTVSRALAKMIYGAIPDASYDDALKHFGAAMKLRPDRLIHRIEYGRTLAMMGRKDDARASLTQSLAQP
ncbi:MAG: hypothetical protein JWO82_1032, partial [Akkermansiaceae bacterium]|nr:hypothetical protein [Akkermansiaceae bacterium]